MSELTVSDVPRTRLSARTAIILVAVFWGLNWVAAKFVLHDFSPWSFRTLSFGCGAAALFAAAARGGVSVRVASGCPRLHVAIAGLLNVGGFGILSAFAQLGTTTSRTAICVFTMPIWTTLLARPILGERFDRWRGASLGLGIVGLVVLLRPLVVGASGVPGGVLCALGAALSWAAGSVYLKWAAVDAHPIAIAAWQLVAATAAVMVGLATFGAHPGAGVHIPALAGLCYTALIGTALAYVLWFDALSRQGAGAASLGTLLVPVVGVLASALILGDRPSVPDLEGFALIAVASLCALGPRAPT